MDGVSVAASIVGIATAGIQISIKVVTLASQVTTASDRVTAIGNDISITSTMLQQLGELLKDKPDGGPDSVLNKGSLETTRASADTCRRIFEEVEKETARASQILRGGKHKVGEKIKLSIVEKAKWPFLQPSLETLRIDLREAKSTLMLMLQVVSLAISSQAIKLSTSTSADILEQKDLIHSILILSRQQDQRRQPRLEDIPHPEQTRGPILRSNSDDHEKPVLEVEVLGRSFAKADAPIELGEASANPNENPKPEAAFVTGEQTDVGDSENIPENQDSDRPCTESEASGSEVGEPLSSHSSRESKSPLDTFEYKMFSVDPVLDSEPDQLHIEWTYRHVAVQDIELIDRLEKIKAAGLETV